MEITVTGRKMTISDSLRTYVEDKIGNSVKVFNITPMSAEVVLRMEKNPANPNPAVVEVTLYTKGHIIRTVVADEDMYTAIDVAAAKVERQLRKYKTKVIDKRQQVKKQREPLWAGAIDSIEQAIEERFALEDDEDRIVRIKQIDLVALTEEEALIQIDLLGHDFFMYTNAVDGLANVMYRRKDGSYGILKPRVETIDGN
ncbi:MAG: ribosome-associated translation inhibitor RaiA [Coriobacteriia bacterium]|nr:ribosome-associated translation inhibitor RaiA [Coriobacteriia bacterium]